jgi:predicted phosphate transport protein (TIGR00153 family)
MNSTGVYYAIVKKLESLFQNYVQVFKHNIFTFIIIFKVDYNKINFMSLKSLLNFFQPQDKIFYSLFEQVTTTLTQMGATFHEAIHETDYQKRVSLLKSLEDLEHKNDEVTHQIFIELGRNFITPFDREDIHYLATSLDDVADYIWGAAKRIVNYNMVDIDDSTRGFASVIHNSISELHKGVIELRGMKNMRAITEACVRINSFENEADDLLDSSMVALFSTEMDPIEVIKKKDLYQMLEIVTDKCEDAANVIESIIIKYA